MNPLRSVLLSLLMISMVMSGCYGETEVKESSILFLDESLNAATAPRGQVYTLHVESNIDYTIERTPGAFFMDEYGVYRDDVIMDFDADVQTVDVLILDTERTFIGFNVTADSLVANHTVQLEESSELMLVDGRRAFETIDMLTNSYNNRWCASASVHEGGAAYEAAAEAMAEEMRLMGFDFVEVTRYDDDPDQLNVVGYNWGRVTPDEYIVIGGHFDIAYMFTPPGGGTNEGANDDTSGSTVSLEMAQALAQMEFDHTVVAGLWACEEEGLLGSLAYVEHLPENVSVRAYMNFDMVSLNYPIVPLSEPIIGPGGELFSATKYDWTISIAGANQSNMERMYDWVGTTIDDDLSLSANRR